MSKIYLKDLSIRDDKNPAVVTVILESKRRFGDNDEATGTRYYGGDCDKLGLGLAISGAIKDGLEQINEST